MGIGAVIRLACFKLIPDYKNNMPDRGSYDRGKAGLINKKKENE